MALRTIPEPEVLRQLLRYDPNTGKLFWKERNGNPQFNARYAGKEALISVRHGYRMGEIFNRPVAAHRIAFSIHHGKHPEGEIDHINGNRSDNRISNLRDTTRTVNARNMKKSSANKSGVTGVSFYKPSNKWQARIMDNKKYRHLGYFCNFEDAVIARRKAEVSAGYHPNHGRSEWQPDRPVNAVFGS